MKDWKEEMLAAYEAGELQVKSSSGWRDWGVNSAPLFTSPREEYRRKPKEATKEPAAVSDGDWKSEMEVYRKAGELELLKDNGNWESVYDKVAPFYNMSRDRYRRKPKAETPVSPPATTSAAGEDDDWGPWVEWMGGEKGKEGTCPIPGKKHGEYLIKLRGGMTLESACTDQYRWRWDGSQGDIVAYRLKKSAKTPAATPDDEWTPWVKRDNVLASKCPIPFAKAGQFEVQLRNGHTYIGTRDAESYRWGDSADLRSTDIVAYRLKVLKTSPKVGPPVVKRVRREVGQVYDSTGAPVAKENAAMIKRDGDPLPPPEKPTPAPGFMLPGFKMPAPVGLLVERHPADRYHG